MGRKCYRDIKEIVEKLDQDQDGCLWQVENISRQLTSIRQSLTSFVKRITCHQPIAATHVLVFMISCEERRTKPFAIPVLYTIQRSRRYEGPSVSQQHYSRDGN